MDGRTRVSVSQFEHQLLFLLRKLLVDPRLPLERHLHVLLLLRQLPGITERTFRITAVDPGMHLTSCLKLELTRVALRQLFRINHVLPVRSNLLFVDCSSFTHCLILNLH